MEQKKYLMALNKTAVLLIVLMTAYSCSLIPKQVDILSKPIERTMSSTGYAERDKS